MGALLVIGDTHCPTMLENYVEFLKEVQRKHKVRQDAVVHIGDLVDLHCLSFHKKTPEHVAADFEYKKALVQIRTLTKAFPKCQMLMGNHDALPMRLAVEIGLPTNYLKNFNNIFNLPKGWRVHPRYHQLVINNVVYQHGDRGRNSAILNAKSEFRPVCQGHHHSKAGVEFFANSKERIWAMQTGCGVDHLHASMAYSMKYAQKPIIGCGVVANNGKTPIFEPMLI